MKKISFFLLFFSTNALSAGDTENPLQFASDLLDQDLLNSELQNAATGTDIESVARLLELGADINNLDSNGSTPLISALRYDKPKIAEFLIKSGAKINSVAKDGVTALSKASQKGFKNVVRLLLRNGANINFLDQNSTSALSSAIEASDIDMVELLLKDGAYTDIPTLYGTLLDLVSICQDERIKKIILETTDLQQFINLQIESGITSTLTELINSEDIYSLHFQMVLNHLVNKLEDENKAEIPDSDKIRNIINIFEVIAEKIAKAFVFVFADDSEELSRRFGKFRDLPEELRLQIFAKAFLENFLKEAFPSTSFNEIF